MSGEQSSARLEEQLATALCAVTGVPRSEVDQESLDELMGALLPVVRAYGDQRAAEALRDAAAAAEAERVALPRTIAWLRDRAWHVEVGDPTVAAGRPDEEGDEG